MELELQLRTVRRMRVPVVVAGNGFVAQGDRGLQAEHQTQRGGQGIACAHLRLLLAQQHDRRSCGAEVRSTHQLCADILSEAQSLLEGLVTQHGDRW
jgi:hypothetical protein